MGDASGPLQSGLNTQSTIKKGKRMHPDETIATFDCTEGEKID
jgi:hypothetical protein